jgi:RHS repeat-associated protein
MTSSSGAIQAQYAYDPYGRVTKIQGTLNSDFQYAGYYLHSSSALNLTLNRAYSPSLGRWINRDPIAETGGLNLYNYVWGDPAGRSDPSGLDCFASFMGIGGPGAGMIIGGQPLFDKPPGVGTPVPGTSWFSKLFGNWGKFTIMIPAPVGFPPGMRTTPYLGRAIGRWLPYLGTALTLYGAKEFIDCITKCSGFSDPGDYYPPPVWSPPSDELPPPSRPPNNCPKPPHLQIWNAPPSFQLA